MKPDPEDAWDRYTAWDVGFWLFMGLALVRLATATDITATQRLIGFAVIGTLSIAYAVIPLHPAPGLPWPNLAYLTIAVICTGVACAVDPTLSLVLFIIYPHVWVFSGPTRNGVILTGVLSLSSALGFLTADGWSVHRLWTIGPTVMVSLLFSVLMGLWITRIIDQSRERAELIEQLETTRTQLGEAHHAQGVTAERERMAREIHDTLAQGFTSVIMLAQAARAQLEADPGDGRRVADRLDSIEDVARENLSEARALVAAFSPVALDGTTLTDAVRRLAQRFGVETGVAVDVVVTGELSGLSRDREVVLLRAAQEALTNVRRHAQARLVTVRLSDDGASAMVQVDDDGVGFAAAAGLEPGVDGARTGGFGLAGMRGRVQEAGGEIDVVSAPGAGTTITVRVPLVAAG